MRDVFVGTVCVIGVFLFSYSAYAPIDTNRFDITNVMTDKIVGCAACLFAIALALFPTLPTEPASLLVQRIGWMHLITASGFLLTLSYFLAFLFTKTRPGQSIQRGSRKWIRNLIYQVCGIMMFLCLLLILAYFVLRHNTGSFLGLAQPVFWLEVLAILFFGISWFVKGGMLFGDQKTG